VRLLLETLRWYHPRGRRRRRQRREGGDFLHRSGLSEISQRKTSGDDHPQQPIRLHNIFRHSSKCQKRRQHRSEGTVQMILIICISFLDLYFRYCVALTEKRSNG
jgi:hypothetical protein